MIRFLKGIVEELTEGALALDVNGVGYMVFASGRTLSKYTVGEVVKTNPKSPMAERLATIHDGLQEVLKTYKPHTAAVEEVFVNSNARTSLKLGQARGIALLLPQLHGLNVSEYTPLLVKKSVVGYGRAEKEQVAQMVKMLIPLADVSQNDTADALAVAICHAHTASFNQKLSA